MTARESVQQSTVQGTKHMSSTYGSKEGSPKSCFDGNDEACQGNI
jgi:hypothetical protein